ncbi:hypothetical protein NFI96_020121 [Prochilodus magdalenae]|nr:hypothetical protein NFI96_020121 [Prochilodus magdalenae]
MQLILWSMCHVLIIASLSHTSEGTVDVGCADWKLSENKNEICCSKCHPGNRLVTECGQESGKLCEPCGHGYFITSPKSRYCNRCSQCTGIRVVVKNCTTSSDTVCGCRPGLRCGNSQCSYCVDECGTGMEPTESQYNTVETLPLKPRNEDVPFWPLAAIFGGMSVLTVVVILAVWFAYQRTKTKSKNKTKDPLPETLPPEELRVMIIEHDDACSFRQPEQEQGGSSESISSEDSETKLIV